MTFIESLKVALISSTAILMTPAKLATPAPWNKDMLNKDYDVTFFAHDAINKSLSNDS